MLRSQHLEPDLQHLPMRPQRLLVLALAVKTIPQVVVGRGDVGMLRPQHLELDLQRLAVRPQRLLELALAVINIPGRFILNSPFP